MKAVKNTKATGGIIGTLFALLLIAAAVALYLKIVLVEGETRAVNFLPQASVRVAETPTASVVTPAATDGGAALQPLPAEQMLLLKRVFAPELLQQ